jgi:cyclopropane-fatty-acyl-phospholipid synthase
MYSLTPRYDKALYHADFVVYGVAVPVLLLLLLKNATVDRYLPLSEAVLAGLIGWTAIEYLMHRFVLHRLSPFDKWHGEHHRRPKALLGTPTIVSAAIIALLVFLPALLLSDRCGACALTLGITIGYLVYVITHHAIHHWHLEKGWLKRSRRWHALHHSRIAPPGRYGVTTQFWDRLLGSV